MQECPVPSPLTKSLKRPNTKTTWIRPLRLCDADWFWTGVLDRGFVGGIWTGVEWEQYRFNYSLFYVNIMGLRGEGSWLAPQESITKLTIL